LNSKSFSPQLSPKFAVPEGTCRLDSIYAYPIKNEFNEIEVIYLEEEHFE
jgi:hypothetical protein